MEIKAFKKIFLKVLPFFICLGGAFFAGFSLLHPGLPPTHDGEYHVVRFYEFYRMLSSGHIYPRWAPDLYFGYGVPLFNYVYPLPNYIASFLHLFGVSFIDGLKLNMFVAGLVGAVFMYLWSKEYWGEMGGIISSIVYSFAPYHFVDMYIRGSVGEVWALGLFPCFLYSLHKLLSHKNNIKLSFASLILALIIFSHNILALMFAPFAICYSIFLILYTKNLKAIFSIFSVFILGIGISSVFWLPALLETGYVVGLQVFDVRNNFPDLYQLLIPSWGSGIFGLNLADQMSVQVGAVNLLGLLLGIVLLFFMIKKKDKRSFVLGYFILWFFAVFLIMLPFSYPIWKTIPFMNYFQFPWRFLSLIILICSFISGSLGAYGKKTLNLILFSLLAIVVSYNYISPAHFLYRDDKYYLTRPNFIDGTNSPGNAFNTIWARGITTHASQTFEYPVDQGKITINIEKPGMIDASSNFEKKSRVFLNKLYFPGWVIFANDVEQKLSPDSKGRISFYLPAGKQQIKVEFKTTPVQKLAQFICIFCLVILFTLLIKSWYSKVYADSA